MCLILLKANLYDHISRFRPYRRWYQKKIVIFIFSGVNFGDFTAKIVLFYSIYQQKSSKFAWKWYKSWVLSRSKFFSGIYDISFQYWSKKRAKRPKNRQKLRIFLKTFLFSLWENQKKAKIIKLCHIINLLDSISQN